MNNDILEIHQKYLERKALYKTFGYDVDQERAFILKAAEPVCGKILEVGTGKGHFALLLAQQGYSFVTFDVSEEEQNFAKQNIAYFGLEKQVDFRIENGEHTSFPDGGFDVIFSVNVLHHLLNPHQVIDEIIRILSPKGKMILADFTEQGFKVMDKIHGLEGHKHDMGKIKLKDLKVYFSQKGFSVQERESTYQCVFVVEKDNI